MNGTSLLISLRFPTLGKNASTAIVRLMTSATDAEIRRVERRKCVDAGQPVTFAFQAS